MQQPNKINEYLETVRQQIRWKRAQSPVIEEINNHITDQKNAFVSDGLDEEGATDKAIAEMGDPIVVGEQLDRAHRPRPDWPLLVMTTTMLLFGLAIKFWIYGSFPQQIIWSGIAILVMFVAYFLDFTIIGKYPRILFFALCAITLASCLFTEEIQLASTIYLLLLFPIAFAGFVYKMRNEGYGGLILCGAAFIISTYLAVLDPIVPSLTVPFLICTSCLIILTAAVEKGWFNVRKLFAILIMYISAAVVLSTSFIMTMGEGEVLKKMQEHYLSYLFTAFGRNSNRGREILNSLLDLDPTGVEYIRTTIQQFLSHSKFIGEGLPISDYGGYPAAQLLGANPDFLLTYMIYRFGWIVLIGIIEESFKKKT
ncbi:MAG: permease prefix domain 1-containing protein [Desulfosporosinus sp.]|nr:permease prefix domain 1-containing protein [Desulfosporosinus sp.]